MSGLCAQSWRVSLQWVVGRLQGLAPHATRANTHSEVILSLFAHVTQSAPRVFRGEAVIIPTLGAETVATEARDKPMVAALPAHRAQTQDHQQAAWIT